MGDATTDELLDRWIRGDADAGEELGRRYLERAREFARYLTARTLDAEEIASEAIRAGLEGIRGGTRPDRFTLWLRGIVKNVARRPPRKRLELGLEPSTPGGELTALVGREIGPIFDRLVYRLSAPMREVIQLYRKGLSREQIARKLGLPIKAIHMRFERAFPVLRAMLSRHYTTMVVRGPVRWEDIQGLRPTFREAMIRRHLEDLPPSEAARRLRIPVDTLEARLATAYESLHCDETTDYAAARQEWIQNGKRTDGPSAR